MGLNQTPRGERVHIALFGKRNAGKSSIINAITGQNLAIVSDVKGTTTDPVYKAMELLPLGPVELIDTPGLDDEGALGQLRIKKAQEVLRKADIAVLVVAGDCLSAEEDELLHAFEQRRVPFLLAVNKLDQPGDTVPEALAERFGTARVLGVSAKTGRGITQLKEALASLAPKSGEERRLVADLLQPGDVVVLVIPIDSSAPKGRLILPQQQVIRDILEAGALSVLTRDTELLQALAALEKKPRLVITDSQVFGSVSKQLERSIPLTSFSILFARYKGDLQELVRGARAVASLRDGDRILIAEGCTHHRQCEDIGTVKIPNWLRQKTGKELRIETSSGTDFPEDLEEFALVVHCGGCMLNQNEMEYRIRRVVESGVPIVNYGVLIASLQGIMERTIEPLPEIAQQNELK